MEKKAGVAILKGQEAQTDDLSMEGLGGKNKHICLREARREEGDPEGDRDTSRRARRQSNCTLGAALILFNDPSRRIESRLKGVNFW